jgi:general stress protein 26
VASKTSKDHLYEVIKAFGTAMLITRSGRELHGRPMAIASVEPGGDIILTTSKTSPKALEIDADPLVTMTFQSGYRFACVQGEARVVEDRALVEKLWSEAWRVWFPGGKDDPALCLIRVDPIGGEFWDTSGTEGIKYAFRAAKAYVKGETPPVDKDQNAKVAL